jgi:hypothetical protein
LKDLSLDLLCIRHQNIVRPYGDSFNNSISRLVEADLPSADWLHIIATTRFREPTSPNLNQLPTHACLCS